ncbi:MULTISPECIES: hypothetical protein [unclassified Acinetobacter]|uniref:hypothetical protein n=1 Tax=unclassified Acinetobacter TaxID=196816 RepID=UPI0018A8E31A|nr:MULTISPECIES: hypothetical protein [unclassified Acinetobacter]MBJ9953900.1 hypothetical protein [Acinetobacter baumannii]
MMNKTPLLITLISCALLTACFSSNEPVILETQQIEIANTPSSVLELTLIKKGKICLLKTKTSAKNTPPIEKDWAFFRDDLILISENSTSESAINPDSPDAETEAHIQEMKITKEAHQMKSFISKENLKKCT